MQKYPAKLRRKDVGPIPNEAGNMEIILRTSPSFILGVAAVTLP